MANFNSQEQVVLSGAKECIDTAERIAGELGLRKVIRLQVAGAFHSALMKPAAVVINTSRGKVIDEPALAAAIADKRLAGAALDVFDSEPLPMESPLRQLGDKVLLSPHSASYNNDGELRPGMEWAVRSVLSALRGEAPDNVYNKDVIPRWRERFGGASVID